MFVVHMMLSWYLIDHTLKPSPLMKQPLLYVWSFSKIDTVCTVGFPVTS